MCTGQLLENCMIKSSMLWIQDICLCTWFYSQVSKKSIFEKMVVWFSRITDIRIIPWLLNFQRYAEEFLFAEWRQMKIFQPNRYVNASYEWPILEQFMWKCCPIVSCLDRPKLRHFFNGEEPSNNTAQNQSTPTKKLTQTSWFQTNFTVNLWIMMMGGLSITCEEIQAFSCNLSLSKNSRQVGLSIRQFRSQFVCSFSI